MENKLSNIALVLFCLFLANYSNAQDSDSEGILFQAVARDLNGNPASERTIYARLEIIENDINGNVVFSETFEVMSDEDGIFSLVIGQGSYLSGVYTSLVQLEWESVDYFLHVEIAITPSIPGIFWNLEDEYQDIGTTKLWSVPYAINSKLANSALTLENILTPEKGGTGIDNGSNVINLESNLSIEGTGDITFISADTSSTIISFPLEGTVTTLEGTETLLNKTLESPIFLGTVTAPPPTGISDNEIATTGYVTEAIAVASSNFDTQISSFSSNIAEFQAALDNINTSFASSASSASSASPASSGSFLSLQGGIMQGVISMSNNKISGLATPTLSDDAATKGYVDGIALSGSPLATTTSSGTIILSGALTGNATAPSLANNVVSTTTILDGTIATSDIAASAITSVTIADSNITNSKLDKSNIPLSGFGAASANVALGDNQITGVATPTTADAAATKGYVDQATGVNNTLNQGSVIVGDASNEKAALDAKTSGAILVGDGTTVASVAISGDASLASTGSLTISTGAVTSAKILDGTIATSDIAASAITSVTIADSNITNSKLDKSNIPLSGFGAASANVALGDNQITGVATPTTSDAAATKGYVDKLQDRQHP
jgi:hypothetical protein